MTSKRLFRAWRRLAGLSFCFFLGAGHGAAAADSFSGFDVPRFVSLKFAEVNVRAGPSTDHPIEWRFLRRGLPVEIIAETEEWRRIRDADGEEGWVKRTQLDGRRTLLVRGDGTDRPVAMRTRPKRNGSVVAAATPGVLGGLKECNDEWCLMSVDGMNGWVHRSLVWGVYPGEQSD